eukprot:10705678-Lingulodinium_polyedra.AAC.1
MRRTLYGVDAWGAGIAHRAVTHCKCGRSVAQLRVAVAWRAFTYARRRRAACVTPQTARATRAPFSGARARCLWRA